MSSKVVERISVPKPLIKWVGGKTQIMETIISNFPEEMNNYHEPFLGGGSVLLNLLSSVKHNKIRVNGSIYAYDLNEPLINLYKNIQTNPGELYDTLQNIKADYDNCGNGVVNRKPSTLEEARVSKENYYYWIRNEYNKESRANSLSITVSAMFIFLNKTCFRGLFRVGPNGFNVPYGHYKNPEIVNKAHLMEVHELIQGVYFECLDFNASLSNVVRNDFVYLDPPYAPETSTSFVKYTADGFDIETHSKLFTKIHEIIEKPGQRIMLSNADVELVRNNFTDKKYNTISIVCKRAIHSKKPGTKTNEVIIKNY